MGRAKADPSEKMRPDDQSAMGRKTLAGESEPDGRQATKGSVHFRPHCWVCLLWGQRGIVFVHTTHAARQCTQFRSGSFRLIARL
jgi:hypothetical protein